MRQVRRLRRSCRLKRGPPLTRYYPQVPPPPPPPPVILAPSRHHWPHGVLVLRRLANTESQNRFLGWRIASSMIPRSFSRKGFCQSMSAPRCCLVLRQKSHKHSLSTHRSPSPIPDATSSNSSLPIPPCHPPLSPFPSQIWPWTPQSRRKISRCVST